MRRDTEHQLLEWLARNEARFIGYSISIGAAWAIARHWLFGQCGALLTEGQFRRVALYARTTGYLKEWRGTPAGERADVSGQAFFEFVAA